MQFWHFYDVLFPKYRRLCVFFSDLDLWPKPMIFVANADIIPGYHIVSRIFWHQSDISMIFCSRYFYYILFPKYVTTSKTRQAVNNFVITSKSASWRQNVRHDVQKFVMTSQCSQWRQKHAMTTKCSSWHQKSASWRRNVRHDVKKIRHDVKKFAMTSKYVKNVRHDISNTSWRQKVCHDVKYMLKCSSWCQKYST